jgi:hypothetical protein
LKTCRQNLRQVFKLAATILKCHTGFGRQPFTTGTIFTALPTKGKHYPEGEAVWGNFWATERLAVGVLLVSGSIPRPNTFRRLAQLPFNIFRGWLTNVGNVPGLKRHLGPEAKINVVGLFQTRGLIIQNADIDVANLLRHDDPHPFALDGHAPVLFFALDVEDQSRSLTALEVLSLFTWRDLKRLWVFTMRRLGGP